MSKILKTERGFTLIEMMIVLLIISILLLIAVPTMTKSNNVTKSKTCESTMKLVQSEIGAYQMEHNNKYPSSLVDLKEKNYVDSILCPGKKRLGYNPNNGKVSLPKDYR